METLYEAGGAILILSAMCALKIVRTYLDW